MLKKPLFAALGLATCLTALADNYPNKPITLVVGFPRRWCRLCGARGQ